MVIKNLDNNSIVQLDILFKAFVQHLAKKNSLAKPISPTQTLTQTATNHSTSIMVEFAKLLNITCQMC
jgi:hypothetical protein